MPFNDTPKPQAFFGHVPNDQQQSNDHTDGN